MDPHAGCRCSQPNPGNDLYPMQVALADRNYHVYQSQMDNNWYSMNIQRHPVFGTKANIEARLTQDLQTVITSLLGEGLTPTNTALAVTLLLAGDLCQFHQIAHLSPMVRIDCAHERTRAAVQQAMDTRDSLNWARGHVQVVVPGFGLFAGPLGMAESPGTLLLGEGLDFGNSHNLHLHLERPATDNSACGLRICATVTREGVVVNRRVFRLGGLIRCSGDYPDPGRNYGCSTAHGILDMLHLDSSQTGTDTTPATNPSTQDGPEWLSIPNYKVLDFIQAAFPDAADTWKEFSESPHRAHDFALLDLGDELLSTIRNTYSSSTRGTTPIAGHWVDTDLRGQKVTVHGGQGNTISGTILGFSETIFVADVKFKTRRIRLDRPLGTSRMNPYVLSICLRKCFYAIQNGAARDLGSSTMDPNFCAEVSWPATTRSQWHL